jgi:predicted amidohydrolase
LRKIRLSVVQTKPKLGEVRENVRATIKLLQNLASDTNRRDSTRSPRAPHLVVLPELANTGYAFASKSEVERFAEPVPDGHSTRAWEDVCRELDIYLVSGLAERESDKRSSKIFNTAVVIGPNGFISKYRKAHAWNRENLCFDRGDSLFQPFSLPFGKVGVMICYDLNFPEAVRALAEKSTEVVAVPTDWVPDTPYRRLYDDAGNCMLNHLALAHSSCNSMFFACADRVGVERGVRFCGASMITDCRGVSIAGPASPSKVEWLSTTVDLELSAKYRTLNRFNNLLTDRRFDLYSIPSATAAMT